MNIGDVTPGKDKKEKYIEKYTTTHYLRRADEHWYPGLQKEILTDSYRDQNEYPKTLQREYDTPHSHTPYITTHSYRRKHCRRNVNVMFTASNIKI